MKGGYCFFVPHADRHPLAQAGLGCSAVSLVLIMCALGVRMRDVTSILLQYCFARHFHLSFITWCN